MQEFEVLNSNDIPQIVRTITIKINTKLMILIINNVGAKIASYKLILFSC